jgi:hypothetical protein
MAMNYLGYTLLNIHKKLKSGELLQKVTGHIKLAKSMGQSTS